MPKIGKKGSKTERKEYTTEVALSRYSKGKFIRRKEITKSRTLAADEEPDDIYITSRYGKFYALQKRETAPEINVLNDDFNLSNKIGGKYSEFMKEIDAEKGPDIANLLLEESSLPDTGYTDRERAAIGLLHTISKVSEPIRKKGATRPFRAFLKKVKRKKAKLNIEDINKHFDFSLTKKSSKIQRKADIARLKLEKAQIKGGADWGRRQIGDLINYLAAKDLFIKLATKKAKEKAKEIVNTRQDISSSQEKLESTVEFRLNEIVTKKLEDTLKLISTKTGIRSGFEQKIAKAITDEVKKDLAKKINTEAEVIHIATQIADSVAPAVSDVVTEVKIRLKTELNFEHSSNKLLDEDFSDFELDAILSDAETSKYQRLEGQYRHYIKKEVRAYILKEWPDKYDISDLDDERENPAKRKKKGKTDK